MELQKQAMAIHFKIFKSQMEYLTKSTQQFQSQYDYNPFETPNDKKLQSEIPSDLRVVNLLPLVEFDSFENGLAALLNESGGLNTSDSAVDLVTLLSSYEMTQERRSIVLEILSNSRTSPTLTFLHKGGLEILISWLKISSSALRDGISLSSLHHCLLYLLHLSTQHSSLFNPSLLSPSSSASAAPLVTDIKDSHQQTSRLFINSKIPFLVGFDHLALSGNPFSSSISKQTTATLKQTILNLYEELMVRIQGGKVSSVSLSTTGMTTGSGMSSSEKKRSATSGASHESSSGVAKKKPKRDVQNPISNLIQEEKNQLSMKELSRNILAAKERKVMYSDPPSGRRAMPYTGGVPLATSSLSSTISSAGSTEIISTLLSDPKALPSHTVASVSHPSPASFVAAATAVLHSKKSMDHLPKSEERRSAKIVQDKRPQPQTQPQPKPQEPDQEQEQEEEFEEFTSFSDAKAVKTNVTDDTQHNTARRKIRWGDEVDGGQLSLIKEFETLLPMVDTAVNSSSSDQTPEEDDMEQRLFSEVIREGRDTQSSKERLSYSMLRKREREAERQGIRISHQVAEMKTLQSLRPMVATIPWAIPSLRPISTEEQEIYDDLDSHELKIQTQRVSRKPEAIYATDESIPKDPDPPAQLHNALSDSAAQNRPPLVIPWTDISGAEPYIAPGPLDHADVQAGLSALPDYVTHLTETQLGILIERLSDSRYCHLLEDTSHPGFMNLVEEIAPGTILRHLSGGGGGVGPPPPSRAAQDYDYPPYPPHSHPPEDYHSHREYDYHPDHHREYDYDHSRSGSREGYDSHPRDGTHAPRDWERGYPEQRRY